MFDNRDEWVTVIKTILEGTEYDVKKNEAESSKSVIVFYRGELTPTRLIEFWPVKRDKTYDMFIVNEIKDKIEKDIDLPKGDLVSKNKTAYNKVEDRELCLNLIRTLVDKENNTKKRTTKWVIPENSVANQRINTSSSISDGDIVYIYSSNAIKSKCTVDIERKIKQEKELVGTAFNSESLVKHKFIEPIELSRLNEQTRKYIEFVEKLQDKEELIPDSHDGSYELIREIIKSYRNSNNESEWDFKDLNLVYLASVGTWKHSIEKKKESVDKSHLIDSEKLRIKTLIDVIFNKAKSGEYSNCTADKPTIGMFGTGFYTFEKNTDDSSVKQFIRMCINLLDEDDDYRMFDICRPVLINSFKGMRAAAASMVLHCLKPYSFPIFNSNMGFNNIYKYLGINIKYGEIGNYIYNCEQIKTYRDSNFKFKNYRILDQAAWEIDLGASEGSEWWPSQEQYPVDISKNEWQKYIEEVEMKHIGCMRVLKCFIEEGGTASSKQLSEKYKGHPTIYSSSVYNTCRRVLSYFEKEPCPDGDNQRYFPIAFQGKQSGDDSSSNYLYRMRAELIEALKEIDLSDIELEYKGEGEKMDTNFDKNLILYGPPGTGKTYNTAIYAVAICDNKNIEDLTDYDDVMQRYEELKKAGRIAFTTFHQSYGYEEFIEGISPVIDLESAESDIKYIYKDGVFKEFCLQAAGTDKTRELNQITNGSPTVWKVSLKGAGKNEVKDECFENGHIRIGWDSYGENIDEAIAYSDGGKDRLDAFYNKMQVGDIVVSLHSQTSIDGIGVITGDSEWNDNYSEYKRVRPVKWIIKDIEEDITRINNGKQLSEKTVYRLGIKQSDIEVLLERSEETDYSTPYVFVIDEINRGNISKIFGELITLIEETKRKGMKEEMSTILPYTQKPFSVPSNVYILGTMNTADRSIAIMDTALRRRFSFVEMMPDAEVLREIGADKVEDLDVARMLEVINERITYLYDREHTIGHAFFTKLANSPTVETLQSIFEKSVIPLLQEYFYEDYQKIQFVLGDNAKEDSLKFILDEKSKSSSVFKGDTEDIDIPEKKYSINKAAFANLESYKTII